MQDALPVAASIQQSWFGQACVQLAPTADTSPLTHAPGAPAPPPAPPVVPLCPPPPPPVVPPCPPTPCPHPAPAQVPPWPVVHGKPPLVVPVATVAQLLGQQSCPPVHACAVSVAQSQTPSTQLAAPSCIA